MHIVVAHAYLGLELSSGITVDHIDGDKDNNGVNNLQLLSQKDNSSKSNRKYFHSLDDVVSSLKDTRSLTESAKNLGFSSCSSLREYCSGVLGCPVSILWDKIGKKSPRSRDSTDNVRSKYSLEDLIQLKTTLGSYKALGEYLGVSTSSIRNIMKEKSY